MARFDEIEHDWDVARWLRSQGHEAQITETGEIHIKDPRCHDHKMRLYVNLRTHRWVCFNCEGKGRSGVSFVKWVLDCDDVRAARVIMESAARPSLWRADDEDEQPRRQRASDMPEIPWPPNYRPLRLPADERSQPYWDYLINERHLPPTLIRKYEMGYCRRGQYRNRVVIPVYIFGVRRGWVARTIIGNVQKRKYLNPMAAHTGRLLFNLDAVVANGSERVVLVEGVFDALRIPDLGVCTFGNKLSQDQIRMLVLSGIKRWVFAYDGDAIENAERYSGSVPSNIECFRAVLPNGTDPGNAPMTVLSRAIREAEPWHFSSIGDL